MIFQEGQMPNKEAVRANEVPATSSRAMSGEANTGATLREMIAYIALGVILGVPGGFVASEILPNKERRYEHPASTHFPYSQSSQKTNTIDFTGKKYVFSIKNHPQIHQIEMDGKPYMLLPLEESKTLLYKEKPLAGATLLAKLVPADSYSELISKDRSFVQALDKQYALANVYKDDLGNQAINDTAELKKARVIVSKKNLEESVTRSDEGIVLRRKISDLNLTLNKVNILGRTFYEFPYQSNVENSLNTVLVHTDAEPIVKRTIVNGTASTEISLEGYLYLPVLVNESIIAIQSQPEPQTSAISIEQPVKE